MKVTPKVCIIIVNYNNAKDTVECLESLKRIKYTSFEVVVVDNCSTEIDNLNEYMVQERFKLLQLEENVGFAGGNNEGIKFALKEFNDMDYFLLLNNDTTVEGDFLSYLVEECESDHTIGACCSHINYYDRPLETWYSGGGIKWLIGTPFHRTQNRKSLKATNENFLTGCVFLFPKRIIDEVGYLAEDYFLYFEDVAYSLEIKKAGYKLRYVPRSLVYHKVQATTGYRSPLSNYYGTRNNLLFMSRYAKKHVYAFFLIYFFVKNITKYALYLTKGKEFKGIRIAIIAAFNDFYKKDIGKRVERVR